MVWERHIKILIKKDKNSSREDLWQATMSLLEWEGIDSGDGNWI